MSTSMRSNNGDTYVLDSDGTVYDHNHTSIGMARGGVVKDHGGSTKGYYDASGEIKEGTTIVGYVNDGKVTRRNGNEKLGIISGDNPEAAGAALYFLVKQ